MAPTNRLNGSDGNFSQAETVELRPLLSLHGGEVHKRMSSAAPVADVPGGMNEGVI
jgi:hypothetical protein